MDIVLIALKRAAADLFTARMLSLLLWPMGIALLLWGGLALVFGSAWKLSLIDFLAGTPIESAMIWVGAQWLLAYLAVLLLVLLWLPAVYVTALLITAVVLMPVVVAEVARRHYPYLERRRGGSVVGSLSNALVVTCLYLLAWLLFLPLWLFAPFAFLVAILLNAWFNQRLFFYDVLAEHADADEMRALREARLGPLYGLAALLGLFAYVPFLNLLAPLYMALAFTHFGLAALARQRAEAPA